MGAVFVSAGAVPARAALAALLLLAALALGGCQTTDTRRGPSSDAAPATQAAGANAPSPEEERRRRASIRLELAAGFYQHGNYAQALEEIRQALSIDAGYAQAHGMLGLVYMDLNESGKADDSFRHALRLAPADSELNNNYGWFLCRTGKPRESIEYFRTALKNPLYATPAMPLHNAGICSRLAGDEAAAEGYFQRSFQVDPSNPVAMYNLGEIYLRRGDLERARFYSKRLISSFEPTPETLWLAIRVERRAGDRDTLASLSSQLRRRFPASHEANLLQRGAFGE